MDLGAHRGERCGAGIGAGEAEYAMAGGHQVSNDGGTDEAGGTGNENTHAKSPGVGGENHLRYSYPGKVVTLSGYNS
jgi:hypothetical protein